jgi:hypothetical protein
LVGRDRCLRRWVDVTRAQREAAADLLREGGGRKESRRARYVAVPVNIIERHGLAPASQFFDNGQTAETPGVATEKVVRSTRRAA